MTDAPAIDKSDWGDGPWQTEADEESWAFGDVPCRIVRNPHSGTWNGYVAVPPSHPWFAQEYDGIGYPVEQELTFAGRFSEDTYATASGEGLWWFGFDFDHLYDFAPARLAWEKRNGIDPLVFPGDPPRTYKTAAHARTAAESLARQAIEAFRAAAGVSVLSQDAPKETE